MDDRLDRGCDWSDARNRVSTFLQRLVVSFGHFRGVLHRLVLHGDRCDFAGLIMEETTTTSAPFREDPREEEIKKLNHQLNTMVKANEKLVEENKRLNSAVGQHYEELRAKDAERSAAVFEAKSSLPMVKFIKFMVAIGMAMWMLLDFSCVVAPILCVILWHKPVELLWLIAVGIVFQLTWFVTAAEMSAVKK